MARRTPRRDSKGRFLPSGSGRPRARSMRGLGLGNMITVRPAMRGLGSLGALSGSELLMESVIPHLAGGGLSALTIFGLRYFVDPAKGKMQHSMVKYAPLYGGAAGTLGAAVLYYTEGKSAAISAMLSNAFVTAAAFASDYVLSKSDKGPAILIALQADAPADAPATDQAIEGLYGMGAIVPEYNTPSYSVGVGGLGAITAQAGGGNPYGIGYGNEIALSGVNVGSFGTPAY